MVSTQQERIFCNGAAAILFRATHKPAQFVINGASYFEPLGTLRLSTARFPVQSQFAALVVSLMNLLSEQIMRVYPWRRQAELLWRARRPVFGMLLLTNNGELFILVQLLLLGSLWWIILKQQATQWLPTTSFTSRTTTRSND